MVEIREATPKDIDVVYKLFNEFDKVLNTQIISRHKDLRQIKDPREQHVKKALLKDIRKRKGKFYIAFDGGEAIGYMYGYIKDSSKEGVWKVSRIGYVSDLMLTKKARGKGIASLLYKKLLAWFKEQKCQYLELNVTVGSPAQKVYEKWGFHPTTTEMHKKL